MGLSKKLGQTPNQPASFSGNQTVAYQWSHQGYTLQDILRKFKLPCVVQCATESCSVMWSDFHFDLRQPLLLYSLRTVRKIHARSLDTNTLEEFGPPVAIPEDYEGWFARTPKGANNLKRHTRIQGVVDSNATSFLVCTKCPAFTSNKGPGSAEDFIPHDVAEGETLKRVCVMEGDISDFTAPSVVQTHGPCLECLDEKGEDVVIPLSHRVMTYEIAETFPDSDHKVFNTKSIIAAGNKHLPRIVSVVHGDPPALSYSYTGLYRCYSVFTEETLLAATLDDPKSICLELATDSCAKFNIGLNDAVLKRTCEYSNALQVCQSSGDKFSTLIKVSFSLKPNVSGLDDIDMSIYENMSSDGIQEVDANSEFEIAWGSGGKSNINSSGYVNLRREGGELVLGTESTEQNELEKCENEKEANVSSPLEKLTDSSILLSPQLKEVDSLVRTEAYKELASPTENFSTAYGENVVKENPLFVGEESHVPDKERVLSLEYDDEDVSEISEDFVEISTDEADYSTIVVKKACEYDEDLEISDDSDSDMEDPMQIGHLMREANGVELTDDTLPDEQTVVRLRAFVSSENVEQSNSDISELQCAENNVAYGTDSSGYLDSVESDLQDTTHSVKGTFSMPRYIADTVNGVSSTEESNDSDNFIAVNEEESDGLTIKGTSETIATPESFSQEQNRTQNATPDSFPDTRINQTAGEENLENVTRSQNSGMTSIEGSVSETLSLVEKPLNVPPQQNQGITDSSSELSPDAANHKLGPKSSHNKDQHNSRDSPSPKVKSTKKQKQRNESDKKTDFSFPFFERLRKYKSGSNVNICSDLQLATDNRFQSSKVRRHPHQHPHKDKKGNVLCVSQDMDLHRKGTILDREDSPSFDV